VSIYTPSFFKLSDADFALKRREVSAVTQAKEAEVTTTEDHGYSVDQLVTLVVPVNYGMNLNYISGKILSIPTSTTFTVNIDTSAQNPFVIPTYPPAFTTAQVLPVTGTEDNLAT